jgi:hypothetical protein
VQAWIEKLEQANEGCLTSEDSERQSRDGRGDPLENRDSGDKKCGTNGAWRQLRQTRLPAAVQGFPVTFTADGKQYLAVTTSNGGGSPRGVPAAVAPELHYPATGNALYVFALPDRR